MRAATQRDGPKPTLTWHTPDEIRLRQFFEGSLRGVAPGAPANT